MIELHNLLANSLWMYLLICGIWGLWLYFRQQPVSGGYSGALVLGEAVILLQGLIGVALVLQGIMPRQGMHFLYGVSTALALPLAHVYARQRKDRAQVLMYALACLFTFGLLLRAVSTGRGL